MANMPSELPVHGVSSCLLLLVQSWPPVLLTCNAMAVVDCPQPVLSSRRIGGKATLGYQPCFHFLTSDALIGGFVTLKGSLLPGFPDLQTPCPPCAFSAQSNQCRVHTPCTPLLSSKFFDHCFLTLITQSQVPETRDSCVQSLLKLFEIVTPNPVYSVLLISSPENNTEDSYLQCLLAPGLLTDTAASPCAPLPP